MKKLIGPSMMIAGFCCLVFAIYEFVTLDFFEEPQYFWLFFLGAHLIFFGFVITGLSNQTKLRKINNDIIREQMAAASQGWEEGKSQVDGFCENCGKPIRLASNFCSQCGYQLQ